ncbi:hypothetical protein FB451DRAFT_1179403 [Mycena latifolia]|nr:hypothetical protein FB451DRAFT_1179403 [Mycena latifolia]
MLRDNIKFAGITPIAEVLDKYMPAPNTECEATISGIISASARAAKERLGTQVFQLDDSGKPSVLNFQSLETSGLLSHFHFLNCISTGPSAITIPSHPSIVVPANDMTDCTSILGAGTVLLQNLTQPVGTGGVFSIEGLWNSKRLDVWPQSPGTDLLGVYYSGGGTAYSWTCFTGICESPREDTVTTQWPWSVANTTSASAVGGGSISVPSAIVGGSAPNGPASSQPLFAPSDTPPQGAPARSPLGIFLRFPTTLAAGGASGQQPPSQASSAYITGSSSLQSGSFLGAIYYVFLLDIAFNACSLLAIYNEHWKGFYTWESPLGFLLLRSLPDASEASDMAS